MKKAASGYKTIDSFFKHQRQVEDVQEEPKSTPKQISTDTITIDAGKSASGKPLSQSPCSSSQIPINQVELIAGRQTNFSLMYKTKYWHDLVLTRN
jgi:hypothetical protein